MDFAEMKTHAEQWPGEHDNRFKLLSVDESEGQLFFGTQDGTTLFNVICPAKGDSWGVCSEDERVLIQLQDVMEFVESKDNLTIDTILARISQSLTQLPVSQHQQTVNSSQHNTSPTSPSAAENDDEDEDDDNEYEEDLDCYYGDDDPDAREMPHEDREEEDKQDMDMFFAANASASVFTVQRLTKDLKAMTKQGDKYGFSAAPCGNNLFKWDVKLLNIPEDTRLGKDLQHYAKHHKREAVIRMEMQFPTDYPYSPPFLRVIRPRFKFLTGHVTIGGSICMEMLTKSGWRPCNDIESILVQVRSEILSDPNASLDSRQADQAYTEAEARDAFRRMVQRYGWNK